MIGRRELLAFAASGAALAVLPETVAPAEPARIVGTGVRVFIDGHELVTGVDGYTTFKRTEAAILADLDRQQALRRMLAKPLVFTLTVYPSPGEPGLFRNRETQGEAAERLLGNMKRRVLALG